MECKLRQGRARCEAADVRPEQNITTEREILQQVVQQISQVRALLVSLKQFLLAEAERKIGGILSDFNQLLESYENQLSCSNLTIVQLKEWIESYEQHFQLKAERAKILALGYYALKQEELKDEVSFRALCEQEVKIIEFAARQEKQEQIDVSRELDALRSKLECEFAQRRDFSVAVCQKCQFGLRSTPYGEGHRLSSHEGQKEVYIYANELALEKRQQISELQ